MNEASVFREDFRMSMGLAVKPALRAVAFMMLLGVAACSKERELADLPPCPRVGILADAERQVLFREGGGRDRIDLRSIASFQSFSGSCAYENRWRTLVVDLRLELMAERGPAAGNEAFTDLPYFVAVLDKNRTVLTQQDLVLRADYPSQGARVGLFDELEQRIPLKEGELGDAYEILIGFRLTPGQLDWNRNNKRY